MLVNVKKCQTDIFGKYVKWFGSGTQVINSNVLSTTKNSIFCTIKII